MRAAIYSRISHDPTGKRLGVERQRADCEALCARRGWSVVHHYEDNDRSAYGGKERPEYLRMVAAVQAGDVDAVVAWHSDRLWRSVLEQQTFLGLGRDAGLCLVATPSGEFDPADADDDFMSTLMAAVAQKESADKSRRMKRKHLEKAERGEFPGGTRAFGFTLTDGKLELNDAEAHEIRDAARRVLAGESMRSVVLDWQRRGVTTTNGRPWRVDSLSNVLQRPMIAGKRAHLGVETVAQWPAIIDDDTRQRLLAIFASRSRGPRQSPARKYLLTGMVRCGLCGQRMGTVPVHGRTRYRCQVPGNGGCGRTNIVQDKADLTATALVLTYLDSPALAEELRGRERAAARNDRDLEGVLTQLQKDRVQRSQAVDMLADGELSRDEYRRLTARLDDRIASGERALRARAGAPPAAVHAGMGETLRLAWDEFTLDERREVIAAAVEHFVIEKATQPYSQWNPARVRPVWR